jgi:predicted nucleic acid-binding protein
MTFVDTNMWYATMVNTEPGHEIARRLLTEHAGRLVSTDYVLDETLTLLRTRGYNRHALALGQGLVLEASARLIHVTREDIAEAWRIFRDYSDKEWSFTDCTSKVVMERLGITTALSFDHHFHQFGSVNVLP